FPIGSYEQIVGSAQDVAALEAHPLLVQGTNTTIRLGEALLLKVYRRLRPGINPEMEMGCYLTEKVRFRHCAPLLGAIEYQSPEQTDAPATLALLQPYIPNQGDAWSYTIDYLTRFLESVGIFGETPPEDVHGAYLALVRTLARRTAQLHLALSTPSDDP